MKKPLEFYYRPPTQATPTYQAEIVRYSHLAGRNPGQPPDHHQRQPGTVRGSGGHHGSRWRRNRPVPHRVRITWPRRNLPTEEELFEDYRDVAQIVAPQTGDHTHPGPRAETNSFRTWTSGMISILPWGSGPSGSASRNTDIFQTQLRAILRASAPTDQLKVMFPMISGSAGTSSRQGPF